MQVGNSLLRMNKIITIVILYFSILIVLGLLNIPISDYNYFITLFYGGLFFVLYPYYSAVFKVSAFLILFVGIYSFTRNTSVWYYGPFDLIVLFLIFLIPEIATKIKIKNLDVQVIKMLAILYVILVLVGTCFSRYYNFDSGRYMGLGLGSNLTSSLVMALLVLINEIYKIKLKSYKKKLIVLSVVYLGLIFFTKSRSLLVGLPYIVYQYSYIYSIRKILFVALPLVFIVFLYFLPKLTNSLRLTDDSSFYTRLNLYFSMYYELKDGYFVIPHGFNADNIYVDRILPVKNHTLHNDLMKYLYNYGVLFPVLLIWFYNAIKEMFSSKIVLWIVLTVFIINALHNTLFSIHLIIPFLLILIIKKKRYDSSLSN